MNKDTQWKFGQIKHVDFKTDEFSLSEASGSKVSEIIEYYEKNGLGFKSIANTYFKLMDYSEYNDEYIDEGLYDLFKEVDKNIMKRIFRNTVVMERKIGEIKNKIMKDMLSLKLDNVSSALLRRMVGNKVSGLVSIKTKKSNDQFSYLIPKSSRSERILELNKMFGQYTKNYALDQIKEITISAN